MKKIEFSTLQNTIDHAKQFGGWIFHNEKENISIWYDAAVYTMTMILMDSPDQEQSECGHTLKKRKLKLSMKK
jgi:hypothetical protein